MFKNIEKIVLVAFIVGFCTVSGWAADNQLTPAGKKAGFVSIFNGRDLTGWDGDPRLWSVKDGAIRGQTTKENHMEGR